MLIFDDIDDSVYAWEDLFHEIVDLHIPVKQKRVSKPKHACRMSSTLKTDNLLRVARKINDPVSWKNIARPETQRLMKS